MSIKHYTRTKDKKIAQFNKQRPLEGYLLPYLPAGDVSILDVGAGPVVTIGDTVEGRTVQITACDNLAKEYADIYPGMNHPVEYQDMEELTYKSDSFDIVHCRNALDHTPDAFNAVQEMKRVCKPGGWVYLLHAEGQKRLYGGHHYHNAEDWVFPGFAVTRDGKWVIHIWQKK